MFTGVVECMGRVAQISATTSGVRLLVDPGDWSYRPKSGGSICVSGVCLTHAPSNDGSEPVNHLAFDVIHETLDRSTLGGLSNGMLVNLEPPLTLGTPMDGHFVQGHVDGVGILTSVEFKKDRRLMIQPPHQLIDAIVPKGSITVDGVSLTVVTVKDDRFEVALIQTTVNRTTLGTVKVGMQANLETDIISKTIAHWLGRRETVQGSVTRKMLRDAGLH